MGAQGDVVIEVQGLEALLRRFGASNKIVAQAIERAMKKATLHLQARIAVYPPPPPTSTYRRTGTLGRSITSEVKGVGTDEVWGIVGTAIPYAPAVIGPEQPFYMKHWKTITQHAEDEKPQVEEFFVEAGQEIVGGLAGK